MTKPVKYKPRVRIMFEPREGGGGQWFAVLVNREGEELSRSPAGTEHEAEGYMKTFRERGAWLKS